MRGKSKKLLNSDKPKLLENPNSILNFKEHDVTSHSWPGSSVYGHRSESEGLFQTLPLSRAIEQQVTYESSGEVTPTILHWHLPLEGIPSQVPISTSCGLKRKSQTGDALDVFDRYSQLYARNGDTTYHSDEIFFSIFPLTLLVPSSAKSAQMISNDSLNTAFVLNENLSHGWTNITSTRKSLGKEIILDFKQSDVRLASNEHDLERVLLKPRHVRDDRYGCLFQQSGSVETQGQSSGAGDEAHTVNVDLNANSQGFLLRPTCFFWPSTAHVGFSVSSPSKRMHSDVFPRTLPSEGSPLKRSCSSTPRCVDSLLLVESRGPYGFKVSGQVYHWIRSLCPLPGEPPIFLQLYIYDMQHELENRMRHFSGLDNSNLDPEIIRLYNADGARGYELPTSNTLGVIVFYSGVTGSTEFDVSPLLFIYEHSGFHTELKLKPADGNGKERRQNRLDFIRKKQNDIRSDYLSGLYDAISRGERDGFEVGGRIFSPMVIHMFSLLPVNVKWPEIRRYMADYPELTASDSQILSAGSGSRLNTAYPYDADRIVSYNEANEDGRHLTYLDFPLEFVWYDDRKSWSPRQNSRSSIGHLAYVHPTSGKLFYFGMRLCHQKGCRDFLEVRTVHGIFYPTCRAACEALSLLGDDNEWDIAMQEEMSHDIPERVSEMTHIPNYHLNDDSLQGYILYELEIILTNCGKSLQHFGLGPPPPGLLDMLANRLLMEERNYKAKDELQQE
ncbi:hypothetical protein Tco_0561582 [Tanacetum coccineum]